MLRSPLDWEALRGSIAGVVDLPDSESYERASRPFNARFDEIRPLGIVRCATPEDVSETIAFTRGHGLELATRCGGHGFAGHASTRGILIDVTPMRSVSLSGGIATIGAGARLGDVYDALGARDLAIPGGTCPDVGVAGLTLGGGLGILGRRYGLTSDHLVRAEVVLADGRIVNCDEAEDEDLFWALRGAGAGNFGVVTRMDFRTVPAPQATNVRVTWPFVRAADVVAAWQAWAPAAPDDLAASLKITATGDVERPPSVDVYGAFLGTDLDVDARLKDLAGRVGTEPDASSREHLSFSETRRFWAELGRAEQETREEHSKAPWLFCKSEFFAKPLPAEAIDALIRTFSQDRTAGQSRELDFMPWGGAYNRVRPDATAFVHRGDLFQLKHAVVVDPQAPTQAKRVAHREVARLWATVHPWGTGRVFPNFADPDLEDGPSAYYGSNLDRLVRVKVRYDGDNVFRFDQSLPVRR